MEKELNKNKNHPSDSNKYNEELIPHTKDLLQ